VILPTNITPDTVFAAVTTGVLSETETTGMLEVYGVAADNDEVLVAAAATDVTEAVEMFFENVNLVSAAEITPSVAPSAAPTMVATTTMNVAVHGADEQRDTTVEPVAVHQLVTTFQNLLQPDVGFAVGIAIAAATVPADVHANSTRPYVVDG